MKEILITSTVLILCMLLLRRVFRGKISSRLQYALWLIVALRLALPASAAFDLGALSDFRLMDLVSRLEAGAGGLAARLEEPIRLEKQLTFSANAGSLWFRLLASKEQRAAAEEMIGAADGPTSVFLAGRIGFNGLDALRFFWGGGMFAAGLWMLVVNIRFGRKLKRGREEFTLPEALRAKLAELFDKSEVRLSAMSDKSEARLSAMSDKSETPPAEMPDKNGMTLSAVPDQSEKMPVEASGKHRLRLPKIYLAKDLSSPCLYGLPGREAVYLTAEVAEDPDRLLHVLVHELVHKRHGDSFWAILRSILVTVYWFHPLVWVAAFVSKRDCELACDEGALLVLGEGERISYGETLLSIITRRGRLSDFACTATTMTGGRRSVKERIRFIAEKPRALWAAVSAALFLTAAVCLFVFTKDARPASLEVDAQSGLLVEAADMQVSLPGSIGGLAVCAVEEKTDSIVIYHKETGLEVGRFVSLPLRDALKLVDEGREVTAIGQRGRNDLLRYYQGEGVIVTEHSYTVEDVPAEEERIYAPAEELTNVSGEVETETHTYMPAETLTEQSYTPTEKLTEASGKALTEHSYIPAEGAAGVPGTDSNTGRADVAEAKGTNETEMHTYMPAETLTEDTGKPETEAHTYTPVEGAAGVPGTDSNAGSAQILGGGSVSTQIDIAEGADAEILPNETITTTYYPAEDVNVDELGNRCYIYVKANYKDKVGERYASQMDFIDGELKAAELKVAER